MQFYSFVSCVLMVKIYMIIRMVKEQSAMSPKALASILPYNVTFVIYGKSELKWARGNFKFIRFVILLSIVLEQVLGRSPENFRRSELGNNDREDPDLVS